jgi:4-amino-4-deoxy-L-arabinose transferase-like glycosyltransferase
MDNRSSSFQFWVVLICILSTALFLIRITGPTDLESYAQEQSIGYLLDLMAQAHWLVQHDLESAIMPRPPLYTWLMALFASLFGLNRLSLALPSFLSVLALGLIVFAAGRRRFGEMAGGLAAIAIVLAPTMAKQVALVGSEPVFTLTVTIAALAAFSAWEHGKEGKKDWLLFWLMAALVTLINGLPGVALATGGLFSYFWEKRSNPDQPAPGGPHLAGITLFLVLTLGWFVAASISQGQTLISTMFYTSLIGDAVSAYRDGWQASDLFKPTFVLLFRYLPFSLPFLIAVWRVFRHPASDPGERRFERFLTCWILFGLLVLSLARHQHADHLLPLWPACALLAGRELARLAERIGKTRFAGIAVVIGAILIGSTYAAVNSTSTSVTTHIKPGEGSDYAREMKLAGEAKLAAEAFIANGLDASRLHHIDTPVTLQLYLGTFRPFIKRAQLEQILAAASTPVDVALGKTGIEELGLAVRYPDIGRVFRWPADESLEAVFQVYRINP